MVLMLIMEAKYLGKTVKHPVEELDTFPAPDGVGQVTMTSDEVASSCPITGQPDFYVVEIEYRPSTLCIESKSLKLYLWGFATRNPPKLGAAPLHFCRESKRTVAVF